MGYSTKLLDPLKGTPPAATRPGDDPAPKECQRATTAPPQRRSPHPRRRGRNPRPTRPRRRRDARGQEERDRQPGAHRQRHGQTRQLPRATNAPTPPKPGDRPPTGFSTMGRDPQGKGRSREAGDRRERPSRRGRGPCYSEKTGGFTERDEEASSASRQGTRAGDRAGAGPAGAGMRGLQSRVLGMWQLWSGSNGVSK